MDGEKRERVVAVARVRPLLPNEPCRELSVADLPNSHSAAGLTPRGGVDEGSATRSLVVNGKRHFSLDQVYGFNTTTEDVYKGSVQQIVDSFIKEEINGTVLAYGQTGAGKTYTMSGLIPLALDSIMSSIPDRKQRSSELCFSFVEVYGDTLRDLLSRQSSPLMPTPLTQGGGHTANQYEQEGNPVINSEAHNAQRKLQVVETPAGAPFVVGCTKAKASTMEEILWLHNYGQERRSSGQTAMNIHSSRSHSVFTIHRYRKLPCSSSAHQQHDGSSNTSFTRAENGDFPITYPHHQSSNVSEGSPELSQNQQEDGSSLPPTYVESLLHFVDLAGSERQKKTLNTGLRFQESISINSGLLALGNVIRSLVNGSAHVPYRTSKLTRLLQNSLGGNSRTVFLSCVAPNKVNADETIRTLQYCSKAMKVVNTINPDVLRAMKAQQQQLLKQQGLEAEPRSSTPISSRRSREGITEESEVSGMKAGRRARSHGASTSTRRAPASTVAIETLDQHKDCISVVEHQLQISQLEGTVNHLEKQVAELKQALLCAQDNLKKDEQIFSTKFGIMRKLHKENTSLKKKIHVLLAGGAGGGGSSEGDTSFLSVTSAGGGGGVCHQPNHHHMVDSAVNTDDLKPPATGVAADVLTVERAVSPIQQHPDLHMLLQVDDQRRHVDPKPLEQSTDRFENPPHRERLLTARGARTDPREVFGGGLAPQKAKFAEGSKVPRQLFPPSSTHHGHQAPPTEIGVSPPFLPSTHKPSPSPPSSGDLHAQTHAIANKIEGEFDTVVGGVNVSVGNPDGLSPIPYVPDGAPSLLSVSPSKRLNFNSSNEEDETPRDQEPGEEMFRDFLGSEKERKSHRRKEEDRMKRLEANNASLHEQLRSMIYQNEQLTQENVALSKELEEVAELIIPSSSA